MPDLGDALRQAAEGPSGRYSVDDVRRTARFRIRRRRALGGAALVVAVIAGLGLATVGDESSTTDVVGRPDVATEVTVAPPSSTAPPASSTVPTTSALPSTTSPATTAPVTVTTTSVVPADPPLCSTLPADARLIEADPFFAANPSNQADLDGDGVGDPLYDTGESDFGRRIVQAVLSSNGAVTEAVTLSISGPAGTLDAADVDGDGREEAFFSTGGITGLHGVILDLDGCELRTIKIQRPGIRFGVEGIFIDDFVYVFWATGGGCAFTGCFTSVTCMASSPTPLIVLSEMRPNIDKDVPGFDWEAMGKVPRSELPVRWRRETLRIVDGMAVTVSITDLNTTIGELGEPTGPEGVACSETLAG